MERCGKRKNVLNIRTWNVDWFRNKKRSGKPWRYFEEDYDEEAYNNIIKDIKEFLDSKPNALVVLQEVPYKIKINGRWKECVYHKELYNDFSRNEYEVVGNMPKKSMISYFNGHQKVILYYSKRRKEST